MNSPSYTGPLVLDAEGLSLALARDPYMQTIVEGALVNKVPVIISAVTLVEVVHPRTNRAALAWTLSQLTVEPATEALSLAAANLLQAAGKHGHTHALDALVCATALAAQGHATIYTPTKAEGRTNSFVMPKPRKVLRRVAPRHPTPPTLRPSSPAGPPSSPSTNPDTSQYPHAPDPQDKKHYIPQQLLTHSQKTPEFRVVPSQPHEKTLFPAPIGGVTPATKEYEWTSVS